MSRHTFCTADQPAARRALHLRVGDRDEPRRVTRAAAARSGTAPRRRGVVGGESLVEPFDQAHDGSGPSSPSGASARKNCETPPACVKRARTCTSARYLCPSHNAHVGCDEPSERAPLNAVSPRLFKDASLRRGRADSPHKPSRAGGPRVRTAARPPMLRSRGRAALARAPHAQARRREARGRSVRLRGARRPDAPRRAGAAAPAVAPPGAASSNGSGRRAARGVGARRRGT